MVKKNILSNIMGKGLSAFLSFVFVPFYLKFLGAEAYGLIGLHVMLQSVFMMADMGLSGTFTRETAKLSALESMKQQLSDLCRTFERIFAVAGVVCTITIIGFSKLIAEHWVNLDNISVATASETILLIGITIGLQFPFFIHQGGMQGLQRQTRLNVLLIILSLLRGGGAVLILAFIAPTIKYYFIWQVVVSSIQLVFGHVLIWKSLPRSPLPPRTDLKLVIPLWRFAIGMAGISLSSILLTQVDKLILTKLLPLEIFGYYALATIVASVPGIIAFPVNNAVYPRFTQLVATQNFTGLTELYHQSCQILAVLLIPIGLVLAFFSKQIMFIWTGSHVTAQNTYLFVTVLVIGSTLMGLMMIPYALQLAFAWTRLSLIFNYTGIIILFPLMIWLIPMYGAIIACFNWLLLNIAYMFGMIHLMHRRILPAEKVKWYIDDIIKPFLSSLVIVVLGFTIMSDTLSKSALIFSVIVVYLLTTLSAALSIKMVRQRLMYKISEMRYKICNTYC